MRGAAAAHSTGLRVWAKFASICLRIWVWLKIKQQVLRRCWSMFPLTRAPFWYQFFEPQPYVVIGVLFGCFGRKK